MEQKLQSGSGAARTMPAVTAGVEPRHSARAGGEPAASGVDAFAALRAREYGRLDRTGQVYLDYTGGGLYAESQVREHLALLRRPGPRQPALRQPDLARRHATLVERARAAVLSFFRASPDEYTVVFTAERQRRARSSSARRIPFAPGGRLAADGRQPQLGQRHPRVRPRAGRAPSTTSPLADAGPAHRRRRLRRAPLDDAPTGAPQPVRLPGAVELLRRAAPARAGSTRRRRGAGTCCSTPPRSCRPTASTCRAGSRTSSPCPSTRCSATRPASAALHRAPRRAGAAAPAVVRRRHDQDRVGAGPRAHAGAGRDRVRGRHAQLPGLPAVEIGLRHLEARRRRGDPRPRPAPDPAAARAAARRCATPTARRWSASTARPTTPTAAATVAFNLLDAGRRRRRLPRGRGARGRRAGISLRTGCFCNPGAGEAARGITAPEMRALFAVTRERKPTRRDLDGDLRRQGAGGGPGVARDRVERGGRRPPDRGARHVPGGRGELTPIAVGRSIARPMLPQPVTIFAHDGCCPLPTRPHAERRDDRHRLAARLRSGDPLAGHARPDRRARRGGRRRARAGRDRGLGRAAARAPGAGRPVGRRPCVARLDRHLPRARAAAAARASIPRATQAQQAIGLVREHVDLEGRCAGRDALGRYRFFEGEVEPCINGNVVATGAYFGVDVTPLVERLLGEQLPDGGWNCEVENGATVSSFGTTINVLEGLLELRAGDRRRGEVTAARRRGEELHARAPAVPPEVDRRGDRPAAGFASRSRPGGTTTSCAASTTCATPASRRTTGSPRRSRSCERKRDARRPVAAPERPRWRGALRDGRRRRPAQSLEHAAGAARAAVVERCPGGPCRRPCCHGGLNP